MSNLAKEQRAWKKEFDLAAAILGKQPEWSPHAYEIFRYEEPGVRLIFYPHRTTARHYHIRVRDGGSKDTKRAIELMLKLDKDSGFNCTFSYKTLPNGTSRKAAIREGLTT